MSSCMWLISISKGEMIMEAKEFAVTMVAVAIQMGLEVKEVIEEMVLLSSDDVSLLELLTVRTCNVLSKNGIKTVGDLQRLNYSDVMNLPLGKKSKAELEKLILDKIVLIKD